ncbi:hypothetical protein [Verrucomicrobium spinosum]|uniref:hypothetical protein n=1 Tax=Verrucomicrobium spinosum TaxID=2736 RepID=UPI0001744750|nr:hypothetical protein [Verrucomicrobium spinosum]
MTASPVHSASAPAVATGWLDAIRALPAEAGTRVAAIMPERKKEEAPCLRHRRFAPTAQSKAGLARRFARTVSQAVAKQVQDPPADP